MFTLFLTWLSPPDRQTHLTDTDLAWLAGLLHDIPNLARALIHTPAVAHDPYLDDGPPPPLMLQLYFTDIADLEAACATAGSLQPLSRIASLADSETTEQAMLARAYEVPDPTPLADPACTYLVAYTGHAEDLNAWHAHYFANHPAIMRRFPAIRGIEICTRLDWVSFLPFRRVDYMQRNKNVFDSPEALNVAINSPVRHDMRADFNNFPPFTGPTLHYPMLTRTI